MTAFKTLHDIDALLQQHTVYRNTSLNLIASENLASPTVRRFHDSELVARYGCYATSNLEEREYTGNKYIYEIEAATQKLVCEVFHAAYADLRPLSGHTAGLASILAATPPGGLVLEYHLRDWGHGMMGPACESIPHFGATLRTAYFEFLEDYELDLENLAKQIQKLKPSSVVLGSSGLLFAEPVAEVKRLCVQAGIPLIADVSHVSGLIAAGVYPNPLDAGADIMFLSTHKSFPGPQGGMVLTNNKEWILKVGNVLSPGMVTSHHVFRLPALAAALLEIKAVGAAYGKDIIANSHALGAALNELGIAVVGKKKGYSQSHIVLADIGAFGGSREMALRLEQARIFCSDDFGSGGTQLRFGTQEATRRGMGEEDMRRAAGLIARVVKDNAPGETIAAEVAELVATHQTCGYTLE